MNQFNYRIAVQSFAIVSFIASVGMAQESSPADQASRLVEELGSPIYRKRESAQDQLQRLGEPALPTLESGLKSPNPEIRVQCERLILQIRNSIRREAEAKRRETEVERFREFVRSGLRAGGKTAPNWERLKEHVDRDAEARMLLIELHEYDAAFLKLAVEQPERVPKWCYERRLELIDETWRLTQSGRDLSLIRPKVRMYVKQSLALPSRDLKLIEQTYQYGKSSGIDEDPAFVRLFRLRFAEQLARLTDRGGLDTNWIRDLSELAGTLGMQQELKDAIRPVAAAAVERILRGPFDKNARSEAYGLLRLVRSYEVEGIIPVALKVALSKDFNAKTRGQAVDLVGRYGGPDRAT